MRLSKRSFANHNDECQQAMKRKRCNGFLFSV